MPQPIEETLIVPDDFSEFITTFPGIYRKISQRLNSGADIERISVQLDATAKLVYAQTTNETRAFLYFVNGEGSGAPLTFGMGTFFANKTGVLMPISNYTPGNIRLDVRIVAGEILASVSSGSGVFDFKLLFL